MASKNRNSPKLPLKVRILLDAYTLAANITNLLNGAVKKKFINLWDIKVPASPTKPVKDVITNDIVFDPSRKLWFRLFVPVKNCHVSELPVILYFHGGGFTSFATNSKTYDDFCRRLARGLPAIIVSVNYRLAPTHKHPSQYEDGFDALKYVDENNLNLSTLVNKTLNLNLNLSTCFIAGDSAGGNVAHHVAVRASDYEFKVVKVVGLIGLQPFFGGEERTESETRLDRVPLISIEKTDYMWKAFLPNGLNRDHAAVNVFGPNGANISGLNFPSTIIFIGEFDPLQDWQRRYYEGLKRAGKEVYLIEYSNAIHGFYGISDLPESVLLIKDMRDFMQKQGAYD